MSAKSPQISHALTRHSRHLGMRCSVGSTLIEVLVSLLLLSFTMLGIAGLMSATTRYQLGVDSRSAITLLFNDLTARVRANNQTAIDAYLYDTDWSGQQTAVGSAPSPNCSAISAAGCSPAERAAYDLWEVRTAIRASMPQGSLLISGSPDDGMLMSFMWFDKDFLADANTLRDSPQCSSSMTQVQLQSCCPTVASVSTPGVRCLNFSFIR